MGGPSRALLVKDPWATQIVQGAKQWELRSRATTVREVIGIALVGPGTILGEVSLTGCIKLEGKTVFSRNFHKHRVREGSLISPNGGDVYAWTLANPIQYSKPRPYQHPRGVITWARLGPSKNTVTCHDL